MRRAFHIQLEPRGKQRQTQAEVEAEGRRLDGIAMLVDIMLGLVDVESVTDPWQQKQSTIRHDEANFHGYIGRSGSQTRIVITRGASALLWSANERVAFARLFADAHRKKTPGTLHGPARFATIMARPAIESPPLFDGDGNRPRPAEEKPSAAGDVQDGNRTGQRMPG